jgi:hypoxanthine phosphoribosyltransferase
VQILLDESDIAARVDALAGRLAARIDSDCVIIALLDGAIPFAADLMRALSRRSVNPAFDAMRLSSYGDGTHSSGAVRMLSDVARPVAGRRCLLIDDICETGGSLAFARDRLIASAATEVLVAVFALKPVHHAAVRPDFHAWDAPPDRFIVGYGMDHGGLWRGLPHVAALD